MKQPVAIIQCLCLLVLVIQAPCVMGQTNEERKKKIEEREAAVPSQEAAERKERSTVRLQKEGVPIAPKLPVIDDTKQAKQRTTEELAKRTIAVAIAAVKGEGIEQEVIDKLVTKFGANAFFTPEEAAFIKNPAPSRADRIKFSWRYECLWVLLWSLGYIDKLERPEGICDVPKAVSFLRDCDTAAFIKDAKLRPMAEILDEADLIYRYHWAVTEARLKGEKAPAKLEGGVVQERHYVLNWIIGYLDQAWDDVSTDT